MASVIIVEDQLIIGQVLGTIVEASGHTVAAICHRSAAALSEIKEKQPDLVVLDIGLGGGERGTDVLRTARNDGYQGRAVFVSAYPEKTMQPQLEGVSYDAYLIKPVGEAHLRSALQKLLQ